MSTQPAPKAPASKIWEENAPPRHRIQWCPGCGDYGVLNALKMALTRLELMPHEVLLIGGVGGSGQIRNYLNGNGVHGTHGGPLAYAVGVKMANPDLRVMALAGDGDTFAIGVENFVHTCRRDPEVTLIVMDNGVYGLTTGQRSPTGGLGQGQPGGAGGETPPLRPLPPGGALGPARRLQATRALTAGRHLSEPPQAEDLQARAHLAPRVGEHRPGTRVARLSVTAAPPLPAAARRQKTADHEPEQAAEHPGSHRPRAVPVGAASAATPRR